MARTKPVMVPNMDPTNIPGLSPEIYASTGEEGIFSMLSDHYRELEASPIRPMFGDDMQAASRRSAAFYVQLLGGPPMYNEQYGNPMMRRRHLPFEIDEPSRIIWRDCFYRILEDAEQKYGFPEKHLSSFREFIEQFSKWMANAD